MLPPIPEPSGGQSDPGLVRKFRFKPWPVFWYQWGTAMCFTPVNIVLAGQAVAPRLLTPSGVAMLIVFSVVFFGLAAAVVTPLMYYGFPLRVSQEGIKASNVLGIPVSLHWPQVQRVRPVRILWLSYLRLDTPGSKPVVWLALFLKDQSGLNRAVQEWAGDDNALVRYLADEGTPSP